MAATIQINKETYVGLFVALVAAFAFLLLVDVASSHEVPSDLAECEAHEVLYRDWNCVDPEGLG